MCIRDSNWLEAGTATKEQQHHKPAGEQREPGEDVNGAREHGRTRSQHTEPVKEPCRRNPEEDEERSEHRDVERGHAETPEVEVHRIEEGEARSREQCRAVGEPVPW